MASRQFRYSAGYTRHIAIILSTLFATLAFSQERATANDEHNDRAYRDRAELNAAVTDWIAATNARDLEAQIAFYPGKVDAFYTWRNASRQAVFAEKQRVFAQAELVDIKIDAPQIVFEPSGNAARMYFRKRYVILGERSEREGEVLQELRWRKNDAGWKIFSERDLRVLN